MFPDFTVLRSLKSQNILQLRTNRTEKRKLQNFIELYTFLDKDFSTLIENGNSCQFSQAVCAKSTGKPTCFKPREILLMRIYL
jgi:hypothetical protein